MVDRWMIRYIFCPVIGGIFIFTLLITLFFPQNLVLFGFIEMFILSSVAVYLVIIVKKIPPYKDEFNIRIEFIRIIKWCVLFVVVFVTNGLILLSVGTLDFKIL